MRNPNMQRRHFQRIAEIIAALPYPAERERVAVHFAERLRADNGQFQEGRFLEACDVDPTAPSLRDGDRRLTGHRADWRLPGPEDPLPDQRAVIRRARGGGC